MQSFPVSDSTLSSSHLATFLKEAYNLGENVSCKLLKTGISHTYAVIDGDNKTVFRVYSLNWRTKAEILEEIRWVSHLKDNQIAVSYPIPDATGNFIQEILAPEGLRFGVMFSFAPGHKMLNYPNEIHFNAGETIGKMHLLAHNFQLDRVTYTPEILLEDSFAKVKLFLDPETVEMTYMASLKEAIHQGLKSIDKTQVRYGAVHTDLWFDNMHFTDDNEVTLFDFDFCGNGPLIQDLGYYIMQLYQTDKDPETFNDKLNHFLLGYESIVPISEEEKRIIPFVSTSVYFFFLGIQCERFDNWSNVFLNEIYLKRFINLILKKWAEHNNIHVATATI